MKKRNKKIMSSLAGAALLMTGCASAAPETVVNEVPQAAPEANKEEALEVNGYKLENIQRNEIPYTKVVNAEGSFVWNQDVISPSSDVFNIYGTAMTGACAKPSFALEEGKETIGEYYINVSGSMTHSQSVTLKDLEDKEETRVMSCACATGNVVVNAEVSGIPLSAILELTEVAENANTITFRGADGYGIPMPLTYALEKNAMIVYKVNGEVLPDGQTSQLWMPGTVAKYFTRDILDIEVTVEDEVPEVIAAGDEYRVHVNIMNYADQAKFTAGNPIVFEGYADDYDKAITAVEFSLDNGETWTTYEVEGASVDKWVYWYFTYTPEETGIYKMMVRAINEDGNVTPLASTLVFSVEEAEGV